MRGAGHPPSDRRTELPAEAYEVAVLSGELLHDLNNALVSLSALAEIAEDEAREGQSTLVSIGRIRKGCAQLRQLVRDVSDVMAGRAISAEVGFDPCAAARAAFDQWITSAPPLEISFHCDLPVGSRVRGRESFFVRAISNLLLNAERHARREVRVRIRQVDSGGSPAMELTVEDDGAGIADELRDRLFEPFVHGANGGSGLGLSTVRWTARQLGGAVEVAEHSLLGGARFVVRLPLSCPAPASEPVAGGEARLPLAGRRVMVVDDDQSIRRLYARLVRNDGGVAMEFSPADYRTPELIAVHLASSAPDAILLDLEMGRYGGLEVWSALARIAPSMAERVLLVSGYGHDGADRAGVPAERWILKTTEWGIARAAIARVAAAG